jgi:hypothetical protein
MRGPAVPRPCSDDGCDIPARVLQLHLEKVGMCKGVFLRPMSRKQDSPLDQIVGVQHQRDRSLLIEFALTAASCTTGQSADPNARRLRRSARDVRPIGCGHTCFETLTEYASTLRSVWSKLTVSQSRSSSATMTRSTWPELSVPSTWICSTCVRKLAETRKKRETLRHLDAEILHLVEMMPDRRLVACRHGGSL